ncbi:hypothetical protein [Aeromonas sp. EERV15]|uniref:hypothetical protein n=1 Tax=Aeromonas sp. EERV15 TaxID=1833892 RepID=UPI00159F34EC|nr:hypothetical protein [Aeromonas sp. EERV15]
MSRYFLKNSILFIFMLFSYEALPKCIESSIVSPSPFMGNNDEIFKLSDGSLWIVKNEYEYLYEYYPSITICPDEGFMTGLTHQCLYFEQPHTFEQILFIQTAEPALVGHA